MSGPRPDEQDAEPERELWIAQGAAVENGAVTAAIADADDIRVIRSIARDVLLLETGSVQVDQLREKFGADLLIERDRPVPEPLQPFGP